MNEDNVTYFNSFLTKYIPKEVRKNNRHQKYHNKIYRIQANNLIICRYLCIVFSNFMLNGKRLLGYAHLFSPNEYEKNDKIILKYFQ